MAPYITSANAQASELFNLTAIRIETGNPIPHKRLIKTNISKLHIPNNQNIDNAEDHQRMPLKKRQTEAYFIGLSFGLIILSTILSMKGKDLKAIDLPLIKVPIQPPHPQFSPAQYKPNIKGYIHYSPPSK